MKKILILSIISSLFLIACQPVTPPTTTTVVSTTTTTIMGDSTSFIQNQLNTTGRFDVNQTYVVNNTLRPPAGSTLNFGPNGKFIRNGSAPILNGTNPVISLETGNVTINNLRIQGDNPCYWTYFDTGYRYSQYDTKREWHHAIRIVSGSNYNINNPVIKDVWGDGIDILGSGPVSNVTIRNADISCVGRSIISNTGSTNVRVLGGKSTGAFWWTFNIEPFGSREVKDYHIENWTVGFSRLSWLFSGGPDFNCKVTNVTVQNITLLVDRGIDVRSCVANQIVVK